MHVACQTAPQESASAEQYSATAQMPDGPPPQQQGWRGGPAALAGMPILVPQFGVLPFGGGPVVHIMPPGCPPPGGPQRYWPHFPLAFALFVPLWHRQVQGLLTPGTFALSLQTVQNLTCRKAAGASRCMVTPCVLRNVLPHGQGPWRPRRRCTRRGPRGARRPRGRLSRQGAQWRPRAARQGRSWQGSCGSGTPQRNLAREGPLRQGAQ